jgi:hypothetical protein
VAVVDELVQVAARQLLRRVSQRARAGLVDERHLAVEVDAEDAVAHRFQNQFALPRGQVQRFFGLVLLGHVHAVHDHKRSARPASCMRRLRTAMRR